MKKIKFLILLLKIASMMCDEESSSSIPKNLKKRYEQMQVEEETHLKKIAHKDENAIKALLKENGLIFFNPLNLLLFSDNHHENNVKQIISNHFPRVRKEMLEDAKNAFSNILPFYYKQRQEYLINISIVLLKIIFNKQIRTLIKKTIGYIFTKYIIKEKNLNNVFYSAKKEDHSLDKIYGHNHIKAFFEKIIKKLQTKKIENKKLPHILLYGPPGNGKSEWVKVIAAEAKVPIIKIDCSNLYDGQNTNLTVLFKHAEKHAPCIVLFEHAEFLFFNRKKITKQRTSKDKKILNEILQLLDGVHTPQGMLCIATTNDLTDIDEALYRPGRFEYTIQINPPSREDRLILYKNYFEKYDISNHKHTTIIETIENEITQNKLILNVTDIKYLIKLISNFLKDNKNIHITTKDIKKIIDNAMKQ